MADMARQPRLVLPGIALHIIQRGNNRGSCFVDDSDYLCYLSALRKLSTKHGCTVHAYCLMTNHVHLLLTPDHSDTCTNLMRDLGLVYVRYFNRRYRRTGTLWEGRYRSCIVESTRYVIACYRYVELNPVRAGMVSNPRSYPWSSHVANLGLASDVLASPHAEYLALDEDPERRCAMYQRIFEEAANDRDVAAIRDATNGGLPLSGETLRTRLVADGRKVAREKPGPRSDVASDDLQLKIVL